MTAVIVIATIMIIIMIKIIMITIVMTMFIVMIVVIAVIMTRISMPSPFYRLKRHSAPAARVRAGGGAGMVRQKRCAFMLSPRLSARYMSIGGEAQPQK